MADKNLNIHIRAKEAEQTQQKLDRVGRSAEKMGRKVHHSASQGKDALGQFTKKTEESKKGISGLVGKVALWGAGLLGVQKTIQTITGAIRAQTQAMKENAEIIDRQQKSFVRLQFLGDFFKERPEARKEVAALAEFGRRPFEEVAGAWYNLRSKSGGLPTATRDQIMREALEMGRTDPSLPLDTLVDMFSLYAKQTGQTDANRIQNVLQQTITEAGGSGADVAGYMPRFLPIGMAGGLSGAQAAGLWSWATTREAEPSVATTGLKAILMSLQGKGTPQSAELMKQFGITPEMDFAEKVQRLGAARQSGALDLGAAETIAQREGANLLLQLAADPRAAFRTMRQVTAADRGDVDITGRKIEQVLGADEIARLNDTNRLMKVAIENQRAKDIHAARVRRQIQEQEYILRGTGASEFMISATKASSYLEAAFGLDPFDMDEDTRQSFIKKGLLPADYNSGGGVVINNYNDTHYHRPSAENTPRSGRLKPDGTMTLD